MRKSKRSNPPGVLLIIETSTGYGRGIMEGLGRYVRKHGPWLICFERRGLVDPPPKFLRHWRGHGVIARSSTTAVARKVHSLGLPVVELLGHRQVGPPMIQTDYAAAGRLAAGHLFDCGLRNFGFFASGNICLSARLREGYSDALAEKGYECDVYQTRASQDLLPPWENARLPAVLAWIKELPKPVGIFAWDSEHALCLLDMCGEHGIAVPTEVAILANDDDPALYEVTTPALSGVDTNPSLVGYEAAALLDRLMAGEPQPKEPLLLPPVGVVGRQSTDILNIADPDVIRAIRFVRQHACRGIGVPQVVAAANMSRRVLERRFQEYLGRSPKEEILRVQIETTKRLLSGTDMAIEPIANKVGFGSFKNFAGLFRREVGVTPIEFRRRNGA